MLSAVIGLLANLSGGSIAAGGCASSPSGSSFGAPKDERALLLDAAEEDRVRLNAALDIYQNDPQFLARQLRESADASLLRLVLEAVTIRAGNGGSASLAEPVFALAAGGQGPEVAIVADEALHALLSSDRELSTKSLLPLLLKGLQADDPKRAAVACRALGTHKSMSHVPALLNRLEKESTEPEPSEVAKAAVSALESILMISPGDDAASWRSAVKGLVNKRRDEVLESVLTRERAERATETEQREAELSASREALSAKDAIIVRLKMAADENEPTALLEDLSFDVAGVRRFAAEELRRHADEWDIQSARPILLERLQADGEPADVASEFLYLLQAIDAKVPPAAEDAARDAVLVRCLQSGDGSVVSAAAAVVADGGASQPVIDAVLAVVSKMAQGDLPSEARTALLRASGTLGLTDAKDALILALRSGESVDVRQAAIDALGLLELPETTQDIAHALKEDLDWRVRRRAATVLPKVAGDASVPILIESLGDSRPEVRIDVIASLSRFRGNEAVVNALAGRLPVEDQGRGALLRTLGELGSVLAVPAIVKFAGTDSPISDVETATEDALWRDARSAISSLVGDNANQWAEVVSGLDARPERAAWALSQRARALEASGAGIDEILNANRERSRRLLDAGMHAQAAEQAEKTIAAAEGDAFLPLRIELGWFSALGRARVARASEQVADAETILRELLGQDSNSAIPARLRSEVEIELVEVYVEREQISLAKALYGTISLPEDLPEVLRARHEAVGSAFQAGGASGGAGGEEGARASGAPGGDPVGHLGASR